VAKGRGMAKGMGGGGFRMPGGGSQGGMLQQIQKLQEEMAKTQESLSQETLSVTAGGGAVTVVITGQQVVQSIQINPEILSPDDVEMVQDLFVAAINEAIEKSREMAAKRMSGLTGGLSIPGLM
jgi:DNA-binding YbaB/EbfC family protein